MLERTDARRHVNRTSTSSPSDHELEILRAKRGEPAVDVERSDEAAVLKAKLARHLAATEHETTSLDVLKAKLVKRNRAAARNPADDELEILKAKRGMPSGFDVKDPDDVGTLRAKVAGNDAATDERTTRTALETKTAERGALTQREAVAPRGRSAFDLGFALIVALWSLAVALALTTGATWWFFGFCVVATTAVLLFGLLDSPAFRQKSRQRWRAVR
jgi:hypothetical protein